MPSKHFKNYVPNMHPSTQERCREGLSVSWDKMLCQQEKKLWTHRYLGIRIEPLGSGHQQLLLHAVQSKGQDGPGLLEAKSRR